MVFPQDLTANRTSFLRASYHGQGGHTGHCCILVIMVMMVKIMDIMGKSCDHDHHYHDGKNHYNDNNDHHGQYVPGQYWCIKSIYNEFAK